MAKKVAKKAVKKSTKVDKLTPGDTYDVAGKGKGKMAPPFVKKATKRGKRGK